MIIRKIAITNGFFLGLVFAAWAVVTAGADGNVELAKVTTPDLGGEERHLIYVSTDKPIYREGESLYLRAVLLNAVDNTPLKNGSASIRVKIRGPKGDFVFEGQGNGSESTAGIKWDIPQGTPGGQYTALVESLGLGTPETERSFEIRAYRAPRLKTQIEFTREGYGPGDRVQATVKADRAEGGIPVGAKVTVLARVDGTEVFKKSGFVIARDGTCSASFSLPKTIAVGDGNLSFIIEDGGVVETASKTIPISLQTLEISFYPEGGDLVAGLASRVYVQANRPDGKPADIQGRIVALKEGKPGRSSAATLRTQHEGRGMFTITPKIGTQYVLVLDVPSGISRHFLLPVIKTRGAVIKSLRAVYPYEEKISLAVDSTFSSKAATVTLHKREVEIDASTVTAGKKISVSLDPKDSEGVLIATIWDAAGNPLAERLIYREPRFSVNVEITAGDGPFVPGSKVNLEILTTDENGKPVEAVVGLTVTDDAVLEMIETREQAPRLPVMVYLENEVRDLADAHVYLDAANEKAPEALDLLLGTQGWRRFILVRYDVIKQNFLEEGKRALAERVPPPAMRPQPRDRMALGQLRALGYVLKAGEKQARRGGVVLDNMPAAQPPIEKRKEVFDLARQRPALNEEKIVGGEFAAMEALEMEDMDWGGRAQKRFVTVTVREYAHQVRPNRKANDRVDFAETLYWHAGIRTSARDGKATVAFDLSDSVTAFRIMGDAFGRNGALGNKDQIINSVEPFYIEPKMPLEATVGDVIELPLALINATKDKISAANLLVRGEGVTITQVKPIALAPGERARRLVQITADRPGSFPITFSAAAGPYADTVTRTLNVKAKGFPVAMNHGGLIGPEEGFSTQLIIPQEMEAGSLTTLAKVYPTPLANMEEALNALLRQPNGCFEQTSSTNYPLVMAQQYFMSHQGVDPEKIAKVKKLLDAGNKKLVGFESTKKGYEWFGGDPAHEALTAYGLMEFVDMAKVMPMDETMIARTREWLLSRRDGKGGFKRNERALDSFGRAPAPTTNAYIVWALLESGEDPNSLKNEIAAVKAEALKSDDSYVVALAANILYLARDRQAATTLSTKLADAVDKDGAVGGSTTSITRSGGDALAIETTSLALLAWLKDDARWAARVEKSMQWLFERCKAGRFGSTQSTVLALKAINAYDTARAKPKQPGSVQLLVDGKPFGSSVAFDKDSKGAIELPDFSAALVPGSHSLEIEMADGSKMPFAVEVEYNTNLPVSSEMSELQLSSRFSAAEVNEGEPLEMNVVVTVGGKDAPTPIAVLGIPAGLEVRHDQLKELVGSDRISSYEVIGRELIFYWRALKAGEKRVVPISLTAAIPGTYTGPASRAYLYYTDEHKSWEKGHSVTVHPRG